MLISRANYIKKLYQYKDKHLIKVVTGMRRVGKSTLLDLFSLELKQSGIESSQIQFYNFENPLQYKGEGWREVFSQIHQKCVSNKMNYIFLDEPQELPEFERLLDGLYVQKNVDLYITGSNSHLLSSELSTLLTGRQIEIHLTPFSFSEYLDYHSIDKTSENFSKADVFSKFLQNGSLPGALELSGSGDDAILNYLDAVYQSILNQDILKRHRINAPNSFANLVKYLSQNVGCLFSSNKISNHLKSQKINVDSQTIDNYVNYLNEAYLFYQVQRFDIKGKKQLVTQQKNYLVDLGLRNSLIGKFPDSDVGHLLENVIYFELLRRGYQIWFGKIGDKEVDFVVKKGDKVEYYQIAWTVSDETTFSREIAPFNMIRDHYPKILLTTDSVLKSVNGIQHYNAIDWLLTSQ